ncbi:MAG: SAF domain-containing protein [Austwickia sp.]|nr:SAF domain-containing protein [Actinomycetota bacterium]MCB1253543.1 hypothetical protein [Austwickia sp.]MCO5311202.1 SAF domain-containing protein [Austwickia sp.]
MSAPIDAARRLRRPSWRDGRLLVGVLILMASVALGARIVAAADRTVPVYAAASALVPGERLTPDRLTRVDVALGAASSTYLAAGAALPEGAVVVREVRPGELVPVAALARAEDAARTPVMVSVSADSARVLVTGSVVDVWVNDKQAGSGSPVYGTPRRLIQSAPVGRVPGADEGRLTGLGTAGVQVQVPNGDVERLIAAMDQGAKITLVPVAGSAQRDR